MTRTNREMVQIFVSLFLRRSRVPPPFQCSLKLIERIYRVAGNASRPHDSPVRHGLSLPPVCLVSPGGGRLGREGRRRGGIAASVAKDGNSVRAGDGGWEWILNVNMSSSAQNRSVGVQKVLA